MIASSLPTTGTSGQDKVRCNVDLTGLNTLRLPARAERYLRVESPADLVTLPSYDPRFILGGGSNVVLLGNIPGLVLHVALSGKRLADEDADAWYVEAAGGENWHEFVLWTLGNGWGGLENLVYIPGTVGAAPIQNIGAYGVEAGELIHRVDAWNIPTRKPAVFTSADCRFGYRNSVFKQHGWHQDGRYLITSVTFRLPKQWQPRLGYADVADALSAYKNPTATDVAHAVTAIRQRKLPDPAALANAGSFFENPVVDAATAGRLLLSHPGLPHYPQADGSVKLAAGWLIDQAGWKGRRLGPVAMYDKQALVLVNHGTATGADVRRLVEAVRADVLSRFGVALRPEPVFAGDPN